MILYHCEWNDVRAHNEGENFRWKKITKITNVKQFDNDRMIAVNENAINVWALYFYTSCQATELHSSSVNQCLSQLTTDKYIDWWIIQFISNDWLLFVRPNCMVSGFSYICVVHNLMWLRKILLPSTPEILSTTIWPQWSVKSSIVFACLNHLPAWTVIDPWKNVEYRHNSIFISPFQKDQLRRKN